MFSTEFELALFDDCIDGEPDMLKAGGRVDIEGEVFSGEFARLLDSVKVLGSPEESPVFAKKFTVISVLFHSIHVRWRKNPIQTPQKMKKLPLA